MITSLIGSDIPNIGDSSNEVTINLTNTYFQLIAATARRSQRMIISVLALTDAGSVHNLTFAKGGAGAEQNIFGLQTFRYGFLSSEARNNEYEIEIEPGQRIAVKTDLANASTYSVKVQVTLMGRA